uniref:Cyclin-Q n=1 Tax=Timema bartmani TaxID=61472 RepID=A0A7R9HXC7_9NEOP|nr:unnamed protein product [Timema bartmani]
MKDVIDVLQLQREKSRQIPAFDYTQKENNFIAARFIFECGIKLDAQPLTIATAAILFHRFFKEADVGGYDVYLIASTTLYLAGKVKDDPLKIRDVINVTHNTLHRGSAPLELGDEYWNMRDAIVQAELLIMRMLKFEVTITHPHKVNVYCVSSFKLQYMFHYLKSLESWFSKEEWSRVPLTKTSFAFLQLSHHSKLNLFYTDFDSQLHDFVVKDFHFEPSILDYTPQHIAVACINLALQCYGMQVPYTDEAEILWYSVCEN